MKGKTIVVANLLLIAGVDHVITVDLHVRIPILLCGPHASSSNGNQPGLPNARVLLQTSRQPVCGTFDCSVGEA